MQKSKPILCFYIGYIVDLNQNTNYGSEIALLNLAAQLVKFYRVYIFGRCTILEIERNGIVFRNSDKLNNFSKTHTIDVMVVSRYVHYFLEFTNRARKTYIWMHDPLSQHYWSGKELPCCAKYLIENIMPTIDGMVAQCTWHKDYILQNYDIDPNKVFTIGNAINADLFGGQVEKQKNRFIWTSNPDRGLSHMLEYFHEIRRRIPDAELYIYRGKEDFTADLLTEMSKYKYIHYMGTLNNSDLIKEFQKSDVWFYPTQWYETFCISALEAQMAGCLCITSDRAALTSIVGERGILLKNTIHSKEYRDEAIRAVVDTLSDEGKKRAYQQHAHEWARDQTWDNRVDKWLQLFGYTTSQLS